MKYIVLLLALGSICSECLSHGTHTHSKKKIQREETSLLQKAQTDMHESDERYIDELTEDSVSDKTGISSTRKLLKIALYCCVAYWLLRNTHYVRKYL